MAFGTATQLNLNSTPETPLPAPSHSLLPQIEPWPVTFGRNLRDFLLFRDWPRPFDRRKYLGWPTSFVYTVPAWPRIREAWWAHGLVAAVTFVVCTSSLFLGPPVTAVNPFEHAKIQYYPVSEYLPPMHNRLPRPHTAKKADPVYAKQEIISVRPEADNRTQTIITPPKVKIQRDVPLPNMAVWTADPIAPTVAMPTAQPKMVFPLAAQVVEPTPDVAKLHDRRNVGLQSSAVEPAANDKSLRRAGQLNIGMQPDVVAPAPALPVQAQRATGITMAEVVPPAPALPSGTKAGGSRTAAPLQPQVVPPQPSVNGMAGSNGKATGQIIALSVRPSDVHGPVHVPAGNRNGEFAAGPGGKPGATGQPESSNDPKSAGAGAGNGHGGNGPAGVYIGEPPAGTGTSPITGSTPNARKAEAPKEMAKLQFPKMHATVAELAKTTKPLPNAPQDRSPLADRIFAGKRYYKLTLNMPNLNSATGSWVVRFAELNDKHDGAPVAAPVAISKVDPVYPSEMERDRVEGTVTLYAVIRPDGTIADVRVLHSVEKALDTSAMRALSGWRFAPGMKNGNAVALEAIVDIPFHLRAVQPY